MNKSSLIIVALIAAFSGPVFAQGSTSTMAPAVASSDPFVLMRADKRAADAVYSKGKAAAQAERKAKVSAAVDAAANDPGAKGKDPQDVKRDAEAKAKKATKADYTAKVKALSADHKAAYAAAETKYKPAGK